MTGSQQREPKVMQSIRHNISDARAELALPMNVDYLNSAGFGPPSRRVTESVTSLRGQLAANPMDFLIRKMPPLLWEARVRLATFLGGDPRRLLLTTNVTEAINLVAGSLEPRGAGEILLSDQEYAPMEWCWRRMAKRSGLEIRTFTLPKDPELPDEITRAIAQAITPRTRYLFLSHVVSATGMILPVQDVCDLARRRAVVTILDGAQAPLFTPVDVGRLGCDYYAGSGHKWLLGSTGTGFLYFGTGDVADLEPLQVSWGYKLPENASAADDPNGFGSTPKLRRLECAGTRDLCAWLGLPSALKFIEDYGCPEIQERMQALGSYTRKRIASVSGIDGVTPDRPGMAGAISTFTVRGGTTAYQIQKELSEIYNTEVGVVEERAKPPKLRVSTHFFNSEAEIDRLASVLERLMKR